MAFYYNPVSGKVQKATAAQKEAADSWKRHENIKAFLGNEGTPGLIVGGLAIASLPVLLPLVIEALSKQIPGISPEARETIDTAIFAKDLAEALGEVAFLDQQRAFFTKVKLVIFTIST